MSPCLCIVFAASVAVAPVPATPATQFEQLERRMQQLVEQERFDELARDGEASFARLDLESWQRRELAFYAIRGYHRMFAATGQPAGLCRARGLLRRVERDVGLGDDATLAARLRDVTEKGLAQQGTKDPCAAARVRSSAGVPAATPAELLPVVQRPATPAPPPAVDPQPVLVDISRDRARRTAGPPRPALVDAARPQPAPAMPPIDPEPRPHPRGRVIAGSLLLVASAGLGAGMAATLLHRSDVNAKIVELGELGQDQQRKLTPAEFAEVSRLNRSYGDLTALAGVTGVVATAATITGIVLLARPQRGRTSAHVGATPWSAMLTLSGRF